MGRVSRKTTILNPVTWKVTRAPHKVLSHLQSLCCEEKDNLNASYISKQMIVLGCQHNFTSAHSFGELKGRANLQLIDALIAFGK